MVGNSPISLGFFILRFRGNPLWGWGEMATFAARKVNKLNRLKYRRYNDEEDDDPGNDDDDSHHGQRNEL